MLFAYLSLDEVNQDLAQRLVEAGNGSLDALSFRDAGGRPIRVFSSVRCSFSAAAD